ncbi:uncharacterized protein LOC115323763 [Ixodes scapularis]|uniref:uncharacterized protein LOC115323763 n=1 Tax=Ixodes scapularis TaxID=6945 RepID=UPI001A9EB0E7|nr:uncharacterized protein LOC115323763 [Ixodes scapularis]
MTCAVRLRLLLLQIAAVAWAGEPTYHRQTLEPRGSEESHQFSSQHPTSAVFLQDDWRVWQRCGTSYDHSLQKDASLTLRTGFGAGMTCAVRLRLLLLQVSPVYYEVSRCSRKRQPASFPSLFENLCFWCRKVLPNPCATVVELMLLISGDVELNTGPLTDDQIQKLLKALDLLPKLDKGQEALLSQVAEINKNQVLLDKKIEALNVKFHAMETDIALLKSFKDEMQDVGAQSTRLSTQLASVCSKQDDLENRSRRNNLLFYGIIDEPNETWSQSESKVIQFRNDKLEVTVAASDIERAHRLGRPSPERTRPIIVNFQSFKVKQHVLSRGFKLKNSNFSVGEDFSDKVRYERKQLVEFAKSQQKPFKLRFDKIIIDDKRYYFDNTEGRVKEMNA